jgi:hypothetical protein
MKKQLASPAITHSEKGKGFDNFFHEQCKKIEFSHNRVVATSSPFLTNRAYFDNYDTIKWNSCKNKLTKMI